MNKKFKSELNSILKRAAKRLSAKHALKQLRKANIVDGDFIVFISAGRALGFISKEKLIMRAYRSKKPVGNLKQYGRRGKRLVNNPIKHLEKHL